MMTNQGNRITQGQFSFLPDLTDEQITLQIKYALDTNPDRGSDGAILVW